MCGTAWHERMDFLLDRTLELTGYQVDFDNLNMGLFFFTHKQKSCFSTLSVRAKEFYDLNPGKRYTERRTQQEDCPTYCLYRDNFEKCEAKCECAFVRDLLLILQKIKFSQDEE